MTSSRSPLTSLPCVTRLFSVLDVIFVFAFLQNVSAFSKRGKTTVLPVCIHSNLREFVSVGVAATHAVGLLLFNDCLRSRGAGNATTNVDFRDRLAPRSLAQSGSVCSRNRPLLFVFDVGICWISICECCLHRSMICRDRVFSSLAFPSFVDPPRTIVGHPLIAVLSIPVLLSLHWTRAAFLGQCMFSYVSFNLARIHCCWCCWWRISKTCTRRHQVDTEATKCLWRVESSLLLMWVELHRNVRYLNEPTHCPVLPLQGFESDMTSCDRCCTVYFKSDAIKKTCHV